jgi:predicted NUDIX family NTP pyrophosphohydrolase
MARTCSAGILLYRHAGSHRDAVIAGSSDIEVLLAHMGGPYWARKDEGAWTIPKGEYLDGEDPFAAALREFTEELGSTPPEVPYLDLANSPVTSNKDLRVWAAQADFDTSAVVSNTFELEWPPRSGKVRSFPEVDRASWFGVDSAGLKLVKSQGTFLRRLVAELGLPKAEES